MDRERHTKSERDNERGRKGGGEAEGTSIDGLWLSQKIGCSTLDSFSAFFTGQRRRIKIHFSF